MGDQKQLAAHLEACGIGIGCRPRRWQPMVRSSGLLGISVMTTATAPKPRGALVCCAPQRSSDGSLVLPVPDAPGVFFSAVRPIRRCSEPAGTSADRQPFGLGAVAATAFEVLRRRGIEYLSQFVQTDDPVESGPFHGIWRGLRRRHQTVRDRECCITGKVDADRRSHGSIPPTVGWRTDVVSARSLLSTAGRGQEFSPPLKLSTGCAAGVTARRPPCADCSN